MRRQYCARVPEQRRVARHRLLRQDIKSRARQRSVLERREEIGKVDHCATRRIDEVGPALDRAEELRVHHAARLRGEWRVQRDDISLARELGERGRAFDIGGKIAVDDVRIIGDDALEHVARNVRHALADTAQTDDAQHQLGWTTHRSRRHEVPLAGVDVGVVGNDVADRRQGERQRMRGDFSDAVVGRVRNPNAGGGTGFGVHRIVAGADPADDPQVRKCGHDRSADRRVLQQDAAAVPGGGDHLGFGLALGCDDGYANRVEQGTLEVNLGIIVVGVENLRHRWRGRKARDGRRRQA